MNVASLLYLSFKSLLQKLYPYTTWYVKGIHEWIFDLKFSQFKGGIPEPNITNYLFTPSLRSWL